MTCALILHLDQVLIELVCPICKICLHLVTQTAVTVSICILPRVFHGAAGPAQCCMSVSNVGEYCLLQ